MKDIYELLNDIEVDIKENDLPSVSEEEREKLLHHLKQQIGVKKKNKWKRLAAAAIITFGIMFSAVAGLSFTTYAEDIPFLGNIFKFFDGNGGYDGFEENAEKLDLVEESNGIKITIEDTVFDGRTLYITYMIEADKDLGKRPYIDSLPHYGDAGMSGTDLVRKVEEGKYVSVLEVSHYADQDLAEAEFSWTIDSISTEPNREGTVFEGDWNFEFTVPAVESQSFAIEDTKGKAGNTVIVDRMKVTPMSFIVFYEHTAADEVRAAWDDQFIRIEVKDDLGNQYPAMSITGSGDPLYGVNWMATYPQLNPDASELILTPVIELSDNDTIGYDKNGEPIKAGYRTEDSDADVKEIKLETVTIKLK